MVKKQVGITAQMFTPWLSRSISTRTITFWDQGKNTKLRVSLYFHINMYTNENKEYNKDVKEYI